MARGGVGKSPAGSFLGKLHSNEGALLCWACLQRFESELPRYKKPLSEGQRFFWHARRDSAEGRAELRQPATGRLLGTSRKSWCLLLHRSFIAILRVQLLAHKNRGPSGLGFGTPEGTRTPNPRNRNPMLYPLSHWRICMGYYNRLRRQSKAIF